MVFVVSNKPFKFKERESIGKQGIANEGESFDTAFNTFLKDKLTVTPVDGLSAAFDALLSGKADYVIAPYYPGTAQVGRWTRRTKSSRWNPRCFRKKNLWHSRRNLPALRSHRSSARASWR